MKKNSSGTVGGDDELDRSRAAIIHARAVSHAAAPIRAREWQRPATAKAPLRSPSDAAVANCTHAHRDAARCRASRQAPVLQCAWGATQNVPETMCRHQGGRRLPASRTARTEDRPAHRPGACPCRHRRRTATRIGNPMSVAAAINAASGQPRLGETRHHRDTELRDRRLGGDLVAHRADRTLGGPMKTIPACSRAAAKSEFSGKGNRNRAKITARPPFESRPRPTHRCVSR